MNLIKSKDGYMKVFRERKQRGNDINVLQS